MSVSQCKILLLDDDAESISPIVEGLTKRSFHCRYANTAEEAKGFLRESHFDLVVVDVLLPAKSGTDFIQEAKSEKILGHADVVMMSGLFTDDDFVKETLQATGAKHFLKKPFDVSDILKLVKEQKINDKEKTSLTSPQKRLQDLMYTRDANPRAKRKVIEALEQTHSYDLPMILNILIETQSSGYLNIVSQEEKIAGISFTQGKLIGVDVADAATVLGQLLLDEGYVAQGDLEEILGAKNQRKIGDRLVHANLLSPHAVYWALKKQMLVRLNNIISYGPIQLNYAPAELELKPPWISEQEFHSHNFELILNRLSSKWLLSLYKDKLHLPISKGVNYADLRTILNFSMPAQVKDLIQQILVAKSLEEIIDKKELTDQPILQTAHFLILRGIVVLDNKDSVGRQSSKAFVRVLKQVSQDLHSLSYFELFERLGTSSKASPQEVELVYKEFESTVVELEATGQHTQIDQFERVVSRVKEAYQVLRDQAARKKYEAEYAERSLRERIKATENFVRAQDFLKAGQYEQGLMILNKIKQIRSHHDQLDLYLIWAELSVKTQISPVEIEKFQERASKLTPEEKLTAIYAHIEGLLARFKGQPIQAKSHFQRAAQRDSTFMPAKQALVRISRSEDTGKKDILNQDITTLFTSFFKKRA